jgi:hypothetical protein
VADLTQNQMRLLRELEFYGGSLIIRTRTDNADYALLVKRGFVTASALTMSEVLYKMTKDGWEQLKHRP